jgi:hypothetical protein
MTRILHAWQFFSTGVLGLYGGLASKIACSAPISAIYTLTYEIVKGALLPTLPKVILVQICK